MSTAIAVVLFASVTAYALFGGADFGAGFWDLIAGGAERGDASTGTDRSIDRTSLGGQPRLVDLLFRRAVDRFLRGLRLDHPDALRPAHPGRGRHRPARIELRVPQDGLPNPRPPQLRGGIRLVLGSCALLLRSDCRRYRLRAGAGRWRGRRSVDELDEPDLRVGRRFGCHCRRLPFGGLPRRRRSTAGRSNNDGVLPPPGHRHGRRHWRRHAGRCVHPADRREVLVRRARRRKHYPS